MRLTLFSNKRISLVNKPDLITYLSFIVITVVLLCKLEKILTYIFFILYIRLTKQTISNSESISIIKEDLLKKKKVVSFWLQFLQKYLVILPLVNNSATVNSELQK